MKFYTFIAKLTVTLRGSHGKMSRPSSSSSSSDIQLSKQLSYILRHGAEKESLKLDANGFIDISILLAHPTFARKHYTFEDVKRVVESNDKKRFTIVTCEKSGKLRIKANQGHSLASVSSSSLYEFRKPDELPLVVHGTYFRHLSSIRMNGLKRMNRNHIHFCYTDKIEPNSTISGFRQSAEVLIYINVPRAMADGIKFYRSENNVILSSGINGTIEPKYFDRIIDRRNGQQQRL